MAGPAANIDDSERRWCEMGQQMLMDDVGTNSSPQRPVVLVDESMSER